MDTESYHSKQPMVDKHSRQVNVLQIQRRVIGGTIFKSKTVYSFFVQLLISCYMHLSLYASKVYQCKYRETQSENCLRLDTWL